MERTIFYAPEILSSLNLPEEEAIHCVRVLRMKVGAELLVADGKGNLHEARLLDAHQKRAVIEIYNTITQPKTWEFDIHIAFAPTKANERSEWFVEKATEIGIDRISPIITDFSERRKLRDDRLERIAIAAMKQSQKAVLPKIDKLQSFKDFMQQDFTGEKYIAHCYDGKRRTIKDLYPLGKNALILIGPEGDFSPEEVDWALSKGFKPVSLGESRLRAETAALVACHTLHILNS